MVCASRLLGMGADSLLMQKGGSEVWVDCSCRFTWVAVSLFSKGVCPVYLVEELLTVFYAPV